MTDDRSDQIAERFGRVDARVRELGGDDAVLVVVTKGHDAEVARAALAAGAVALGESYAPELAAKAEEVPGATWHFVGQLQTNKVRKIVDHVALYQSVDRPSLVSELARRRPGAEVLLQVALDGNGGRGGVEWAGLPSLLETASGAGLAVRGLMAVAPNIEVAQRRPYFARLRAAVDEFALDHCSMGMSDDFEVALAEGATMVRIGTTICGPRADR